MSACSDLWYLIIVSYWILILGYLKVLLASLSVISSGTSTQPLIKPSLKRIPVPDGSRLAQNPSIQRSSDILFDEHTFDVATRDEEETFRPVDFGLLDSGGAYIPAKGVTTIVTESPAPRIYGTTESPGLSRAVNSQP
jgi:hypothetical protein